MCEVISFYRDQIENSIILEKLSLTNEKFIILSCHREENIDPENKFEQLIKLLNELASNFNCKVIVTTHPRTRKRISDNNSIINKNVILHDPFSFTDYCKLQQNSLIVVSDSGTIAEETSILGFNAINIRDSHERPEAIEESPFILSSMDFEDVINKIKILLRSKNRKNSFINKVKDYQDQNVSEKILRIILGYTSFVERETWKKY